MECPIVVISPEEAPGSTTFTGDGYSGSKPTRSARPKDLSSKLLQFTKPDLWSEGICSASQPLLVNICVFDTMSLYNRSSQCPYRALIG